MLITIVVYVGVVVAMLASGLSRFGSAGLGDAAEVLLGRTGAEVIAIAACLSTLSGANAFLLATSEVVHSLAHKEELPTALARTTRKGHPLTSVGVIAAVAASLVWVDADDLVAIANVGALAAMIVVNVAAARLARACASPAARSCRSSPPSPASSSSPSSAGPRSPSDSRCSQWACWCTSAHYPAKRSYDAEGGRMGRFQSWVEASSVLAAAIYGLGWILTARFLGRFGVAPEEVGFSFSYLLIRVAFVVLLFFALAGGTFWILTRLAELTGQTRIQIPRPSIGRAIGFTAAGLFVGAQVLFFVPMVLILGLLIIAGLFSYESLSFSPRTALRMLAGAVVLVAAVGMLAVPFVAADAFANRIKDGHELKMSVLPGIPGLSALRVDATTVDGSDLSPELGDAACLHLLGSAGGVVVLYDHETDTVLRLSQERVSLEHPCGGK